MISRTFQRLPRGLLALTALVALGAVAGAVIAQHGFGMQPCPWCIFQRVLYLGVAAVALLGWAVPAGRAVMPASAGVLLIALGGVAAAVFQHQVASRDASCALTFADRFLNTTGLEALFPALFQVTATCLQAASYRLLGLPFEVWSGALFALLAVTALLLLWHRRPRGR
jgi:disulfide bond formation protein DsbB